MRNGKGLLAERAVQLPANNHVCDKKQERKNKRRGKAHGKKAKKDGHMSRLNHELS